jgi:hypothetical protein
MNAKTLPNFGIRVKAVDQTEHGRLCRQITFEVE